MFHTLFIIDEISLSQAQASASQFSTPAHSMYQELELILSDSLLSAVAVLFHTFCIDDQISLSQAQASASRFYRPAHSMYQEVEIFLNDSFPSIVPYILQR